MPAAAPRIDARLVAALAQIDDPRLPIAEINRRLGPIAQGLDLVRPSYEQVRVVLHALRKARREPGIGVLLLDIAYRTRSPDQVLAALTDTK